MLDREPPDKINAHSWTALKRKGAYITDAKHINHIGKDVLPARNYNCPDQSLESFLKEMRKNYREYLRFREGRQSEPIDRKFDELVYSTLPGAYLTAEERDRIEEMIIAKFGPQAAIRTAWHISSDGRADLHVIISATQPTKEDPNAYEVIFGRRLKDWIAACIVTDRKIARFLNTNPNKHIHHTASVDLARKNTADKEKPQLLAEQIAEEYPDTSINRHNIAEIITKLGHQIIKVTKNSITLIYQGAVEHVTRPIYKLLQEIRAAQRRYKPKPLAEQIAEQWPDTRIDHNNIAGILTEHGHAVVEVTKKSISLINQGAPNEVTWSLHKLLKEILAVQVRSKRQKFEKECDRKKALALEEPTPEPTPSALAQTQTAVAPSQAEAPETPETREVLKALEASAQTVSQEDQKDYDAPNKPETPPARTSAEYIHQTLYDFFEASTGHVTVSSKRLKELIDATKDMFRPGKGILKEGTLKKLTDEQRKSIAGLAKKYAKQYNE